MTKSLCASYETSPPTLTLTLKIVMRDLFQIRTLSSAAKTFLSFEHKTLASLLISVQARTRKVLTDIKKRAEELDARHPGSTFVHELGFYKSIVLVTGPFGNLSSDFSTLVDFIARERAMQTMKLRSTNPAVTLAVHRRALVRRNGILTSRGWAQHIVDRWRDAVTNPTASHTTEIYLAADEFLSDNPHRVTAYTCLALKAPCTL